jgi:hypothetical protein
LSGEFSIVGVSHLNIYHMFLILDVILQHLRSCHHLLPHSYIPPPALVGDDGGRIALYIEIISKLF